MKRLTGLFTVFITIIFISSSTIFANETRVFDFAGLLDQEEQMELEALANEYGLERDTDIIILTYDEDVDVELFMKNFYDQNIPGRNAVILTIDMHHREVHVAGFYKGEEYVDNHRATLIRKKITPDLSDGYYYDAFYTFIETTNDYFDFEPGVNPENVLFKFWFQLIVSLGLAAVIVGFMAYTSGGKVTTNARTYQNEQTSKVLQRKDVYVRTTTTRRRKPKDNNRSGGGGGGRTGGGHSYSGSRGGF